jgi:hypothetical protein
MPGRAVPRAITVIPFSPRARAAHLNRSPLLHPSVAVALTGPDRWLRPKIAVHLTAAGLHVRGIGAGAATVRGYDALVYVPPMMPGASPARDVGASQARLTFAAAAQGKVSRVVVVSRVGPDKARDPYLDALRGVEASAAHMCSVVTVVRAAHPIGAPDDPGPVAEALRDATLPPDGPPTTVQPVVLADLLDVIQASVEGRIGAGVVEVGGPVRMPLPGLRDLLRTMPLPPRGRGLLAALRPGSRKAAEAAERFLALDSVAARRLGPPLGAPGRDVQEMAR